MSNQKRAVKGYKIKPDIYNEAMRKCIDSGSFLAVHIEFLVKCIAEGEKITVKTKEGKLIKIKI